MRRACLALALVAACGEDNLRTVPCVESQNAFDIEEVSTLQDAYALRGDLVPIADVPSRHPVGSTWRIGRVDVLIMIPEREFDSYPGDVTLAVVVVDGDEPLRAQQWQVTQTLQKDALEWARVTLADPELADTPNFRRAWWSFDFSQVIPESGMSAPRYLVGAAWQSTRRPLIGASNFDRTCAGTWSDYDDGEGWVLNGTDEGEVCNWPMLRVTTETITQKESCD